MAKLSEERLLWAWKQNHLHGRTWQELAEELDVSKSALDKAKADGRMDDATRDFKQALWRELFDDLRDHLGSIIRGEDCTVSEQLDGMKLLLEFFKGKPPQRQEIDSNVTVDEEARELTEKYANMPKKELRGRIVDGLRLLDGDRIPGESIGDDDSE